MLATYVRRMRNNNLEIGIAGSSCHPQKTAELYMYVNIVSSYQLLCLVK